VHSSTAFLRRPLQCVSCAAVSVRSSDGPAVRALQCGAGEADLDAIAQAQLLHASYNPSRAAAMGPEVEKHLKEVADKESKAAAADYDGDDEDKALLERLRAELHADMDAVKMEPAQTGEWA